MYVSSFCQRIYDGPGSLAKRKSFAGNDLRQFALFGNKLQEEVLTIE